MLFDLKAIQILTKALNLPQKEEEELILNHFNLISQIISTEFVAFIVENDPGKIEEINKLFNSKKTRNTKKAYIILADQIKFIRFTYPELDEKIKLIIKRYESKLFFSFLESGPEDSILKLLEYFNKKIEKIDYYRDLYKEAKKRYLENKKHLNKKVL